MIVKRTEQIQLELSNILSILCHLSNNLWNKADYIIRQELFDTGKWIHYNSLAGVLKTSENFKALPAQTAQQVLKILDRSWKSFFRLIKEYSKNPDKFFNRPKLPKYKKKNGEFMLIFTNQQVKIVNGYLIFPKKLEIKIETRLGDDTNIREVRIIPNGIGYVCEIVYEKDVEILDLNAENVAGIDFGLRNIVTIANNIGEQPIVIKGGFVKSINQYYNKMRAEIQSIYDHQKIKDGHSMQVLITKRNNKIKDGGHKISRHIINYCIKHNIGTLVIGYNENWKQQANLGKKNNQNFVSIPFYILKHDIEYKGEEVGIQVIEQEESHTSKCSFLDYEPVEHHKKYAGKRIKRGLFRSAKGTLINADVQGALNIIKKAIPKAFSKENVDEIEGVGLHPKRCLITSFKGVC